MRRRISDRSGRELIWCSKISTVTEYEFPEVRPYIIELVCTQVGMTCNHSTVVVFAYTAEDALTSYAQRYEAKQHKVLRIDPPMNDRERMLVLCELQGRSLSLPPPGSKP